MANPYYQPGDHRGPRVEDLFAAIAPRYDLINDVQSFGLHRLWKRRMVRMANVTKGDLVLDVCCGTGDIAATLAQCGARVVGIDFSAPMLQVAGTRMAIWPAHVSLIRGDAHQLPFADNTFEAVTVGYGLRNLARWDRGLEEMWRVARPGARLLVLDFGKPGNPLWRAIYFRYLGWFVPLFGKVFCRNAPAYAYILESLRHYPAQQGVAATLQRLGCREVQTINLLGGAMSISAGIK